MGVALGAERLGLGTDADAVAVTERVERVPDPEGERWEGEGEGVRVLALRVRELRVMGEPVGDALVGVSVREEEGLRAVVRVVEREPVWVVVGVGDGVGLRVAEGVRLEVALGVPVPVAEREWVALALRVCVGRLAVRELRVGLRVRERLHVVVRERDGDGDRDRAVWVAVADVLGEAVGLVLKDWMGDVEGLAMRVRVLLRLRVLRVADGVRLGLIEGGDGDADAEAGDGLSVRDRVWETDRLTDAVGLCGAVGVGGVELTVHEAVREREGPLRVGVRQGDREGLQEIVQDGCALAVRGTHGEGVREGDGEGERRAVAEDEAEAEA